MIEVKRKDINNFAYQGKQYISLFRGSCKDCAFYIPGGFNCNRPDVKGMYCSRYAREDNTPVIWVEVTSSKEKDNGNS